MGKQEISPRASVWWRFDDIEVLPVYYFLTFTRIFIIIAAEASYCIQVQNERF